MNTNFVVNEYALVWYLLFQASISETVYKLKQKLWDTFKTEYNKTFNDRESIITEKKDFIPNDETIYNVFFESKDYQKIKKQVEKYRLELMRIWDKNKKITEKFYSKIIRKKTNDYTFYVVANELEIIDIPTDDTAIIGISIDKKDPLEYLLKLNMALLNNNTKKYDSIDEKIKQSIIELAVLNEYASDLYGRSCYLSGTPELMELKRWLYPYWLMYLDVPKDELLSRMMRDKISFEVESYAYEKELKKMNIEEFIDFCIRNKKYIIRTKKEKEIKEDEELL